MRKAIGVVRNLAVVYMVFWSPSNLLHSLSDVVPESRPESFTLVRMGIEDGVQQGLRYHGVIGK